MNTTEQQLALDYFTRYLHKYFDIHYLPVDQELKYKIYLYITDNYCSMDNTRNGYYFVGEFLELRKQYRLLNIRLLKDNKYAPKIYVTNI